MLRTYSSESEIVVMTLPLPRKGHTNPALYMVKYLFYTNSYQQKLVKKINLFYQFLI